MDHISNILKLFEKLRYRHDMFTVFSDFLEMSAISISNSVDLLNYQKREKRYMEIGKKYSKEEITIFPQIFGQLVLALEEQPADILGSVFMQLGISSSWKGQFFTPMSLCDLLGQLAINEESINDKGIMEINEPACGGGATIIGLANALKEKRYNYQKLMRVIAQDIDIKAVHMCYIQLSLLGIDAQILRGDTLSFKFDDVWRTPNHVLQWTKLGEAPPEPRKEHFEQLSLAL